MQKIFFLLAAGASSLGEDIRKKNRKHFVTARVIGNRDMEFLRFVSHHGMRTHKRTVFFFFLTF